MPFWHFRGNVRYHLWLIGRLLVDFLSVTSEHFLTGVTAEMPRANIHSKLAFFFKGVGQSGPKFRVEGEVSLQTLVHDYFVKSRCSLVENVILSTFVNK